MWQTYPNIEYDEKTRRLNRIMKLIAVPVFVGLFSACVGGLVLIAESMPGEPTVLNDTNGAVICFQSFEERGSGDRYVKSSARLEPGDEAEVAGPGFCSVYDSRGAYTSCLRVPDEAGDTPLRASQASRNISAERCAFPN